MLTELHSTEEIVIESLDNNLREDKTPGIN